MLVFGSIGRVTTSDGIDLMQQEYIGVLPEAREGDGLPCNAGSRDCACFIPPAAGSGQRGEAGAGPFGVGVARRVRADQPRRRR